MVKQKVELVLLLLERKKLISMSKIHTYPRSAYTHTHTRTRPRILNLPHFQLYYTYIYIHKISFSLTTSKCANTSCSFLLFKQNIC